MSSLAAACADGFYQPPDWDPAVEGRDAFQARGKSKWQAHPLRERAKKLHTEGILVTRFEVPFDIWCGGCNMHIAKGVRFNADKKRAGNYLSTPIWAFSMKCTNCPCTIEIRTNPQIGDFEVTEGARRKEENYTEADAEVERIDTADDKAKRAADPFAALEHRTHAEATATARKHWLTSLTDNREERWGSGNDYDLSSQLRKRLREDKKESRSEQLKLQARGIGVVDSLLKLSAADERAVLNRGKQAKAVPGTKRPWLGGIFDGTPARAHPNSGAQVHGGKRESEVERRLRLLHQQRKALAVGVQSKTGPARSR
ncbi:hypothetical protein T492DRAFT_979864 [Pavlovales sp. CCMP2436]|nr:hypothetical protein T492DRAFT_979864 [Pavlovales sp. CCMP2436]|mmetsp:Transcript_44591/g.110545  ORF Transcript_44591/g.110545 Transcript_44591/m.110545 type:complete len:314 (-) Transcript_44591:125-1066(-)